jgi:hypothetical protein
LSGTKSGISPANGPPEKKMDENEIKFLIFIPAKLRPNWKPPIKPIKRYTMWKDDPSLRGAMDI